VYGMVNLAIQEFIAQRYGDAVWQQVKQQAAPDIGHFLTMEQYPEEVTLNMVTAAADLTGDETTEMLEAIGEYFVQFARRSGYGDLLDVIGTTVPEALTNLDNMHARVGLIFPDLKPPTFWCTDLDEHSLILHYESDREGLDRMVRGAVRGLAAVLDTTASVEQIASKGDGADHARFLVTFGEEEDA
jgi:Haem-NO-binding